MEEVKHSFDEICLLSLRKLLQEVTNLNEILNLHNKNTTEMILSESNNTYANGPEQTH